MFALNNFYSEDNLGILPFNIGTLTLSVNRTCSYELPAVIRFASGEL